MRFTTVLPLLVFAFLASPGQAEEGVFVLPDVTYPALPETGASPEAFVPKGWVLETKVTGDLDADGLEDAALVLRDKDPANVVSDPQFGVTPFDTNPRMLVVIFAQPTGGYRLALENHRLIPRPESSSQDDVLSESGGVSIARGNLKVALYLFMSAGGWDTGNTSYTFRHEKGRFRLIGHDTFNVHRGSGDITHVSINLLTGTVVVKTGSISDDAEKVTIRRLKKRPVLTIEDVGDGSGVRFEY